MDNRTLGGDGAVVVKPIKQGSTIGLTVVKRAEDLQTAIDTALRYDDEVMIEQFINGREFTVGILREKPDLVRNTEKAGYRDKITPVRPAHHQARAQRRIVPVFGDAPRFSVDAIRDSRIPSKHDGNDPARCGRSGQAIDFYQRVPGGVAFSADDRGEAA